MTNGTTRVLHDAGVGDDGDVRRAGAYGRHVLLSAIQHRPVLWLVGIRVPVGLLVSDSSSVGQVDNLSYGSRRRRPAASAAPKQAAKTSDKNLARIYQQAIEQIERSNSETMPEAVPLTAHLLLLLPARESVECPFSFLFEFIHATLDNEMRPDSLGAENVVGRGLPLTPHANSKRPSSTFQIAFRTPKSVSKSASRTPPW